jgi:hypothetical protein
MNKREISRKIQLGIRKIREDQAVKTYSFHRG